MSGGDNRKNNIGRYDGDQACTAAQRGVAGHDRCAALAEGTGHDQNVTVQALVRIHRAYKRKMRKFRRIDPAQTALANFFDQRSGRTDADDFERAYRGGIFRNQLAGLGRGEGDRAVREQNRTFGGLAVGWQAGRSIDGENQRRMRGCGTLGMLIDVFDRFCDGAGYCSPKTSAENRIDNYTGAGDFRPRRFPGSFVENGNYIVAGFAPALQVDRGITVQLFGLREQEDLHNGLGYLQVPRDYQTISAVISFSTKHGNFARVAFGSVDDLAARFRDVTPSGFHELQTGNTVALGGQAVDFAHFGSGENLHVNDRR